MKSVFRIGEISDFFDLPESTLRHWESVGALHPRQNPQNGYREYTIGDLMTISDFLFYRSLGLSLKEITAMKTFSLQQQTDILNSQLFSLIREQRLLKHRIDMLRGHQTAMETVEYLKTHSFEIAPIDTVCIVPFSLIDAEVLSQYIESPYLCSRVQSTADIGQVKRGLTVPPESVGARDPVLWRDHGGQYMVCLMKEQIGPVLLNDLGEILSKIHRQHATGDIISRYLTCATEDGVCCDFYKCYIEILDMP